MEADEADEDEDIAMDNFVRVELLKQLSKLKKDDPVIREKLDASITDYKSSILVMACILHSGIRNRTSRLGLRTILKLV